MSFLLTYISSRRPRTSCPCSANPSHFIIRPSKRHLFSDASWLTAIGLAIFSPGKLILFSKLMVHTLFRVPSQFNLLVSFPLPNLPFLHGDSIISSGTGGQKREESSLAKRLSPLSVSPARQLCFSLPNRTKFGLC